MQITLDLPEDIAEDLGAKWTNLPRAALESLAVEAYRADALSASQLRRLKEHGVFDQAAEDFEQDCETLRRIRELNVQR